mmetsp:Transcript_9634/g.27315  ORF Transcript_9634/g.27315 Transcript_9634/m.27315 type:complete len:343 (-) Transcript_9634:291-1319(-)
MLQVLLNPPLGLLWTPLFHWSNLAIKNLGRFRLESALARIVAAGNVFEAALPRSLQSLRINGPGARFDSLHSVLLCSHLGQLAVSLDKACSNDQLVVVDVFSLVSEVDKEVLGSCLDLLVEVQIRRHVLHLLESLALVVVLVPLASLALIAADVRQALLDESHLLPEFLRGAAALGRHLRSRIPRIREPRVARLPVVGPIILPLEGPVSIPFMRSVVIHDDSAPFPISTSACDAPALSRDKESLVVVAASALEPLHVLTLLDQGPALQILRMAVSIKDAADGIFYLAPCFGFYNFHLCFLLHFRQLGHVDPTFLDQLELQIRHEHLSHFSLQLQVLRGPARR